MPQKENSAPFLTTKRNFSEIHRENLTKRQAENAMIQAFAAVLFIGKPAQARDS